MINLNPALQPLVHIIPSGKRLVGKPCNVEYKALAAEGKTTHGLSPVGKKVYLKAGAIQLTEADAVFAGLKTVLTESGVLYVSDDGRHVIQGPLYDVGSDHPVNVTNQLLGKRLNAL
ncbi:disulfide isomerase DsbC N-terminal domain-containing protein, partial [Klebsiella pneumoniae]|uniref:disulfide isomerase DsbC N-terminal domain-containing protein n=1 Tax=Klebsiella pneumoniae TaxID=573 RepID=UPI00405542B6